jgi:hypothetical protein
MKFHKILLVYLLSMAIIFNILPIALANPIPLPALGDPGLYFATLLLMIVVSIMIEFGIFYLFLKERYDLDRTIALPVIYVNLGTILITNLVAKLLFINFSYVINLFLLAELIPFIFEPIIFYFIFKNLRKVNNLDLSFSRYILMIFTANLASFLMSWLTYPFPFII